MSERKVVEQVVNDIPLSFEKKFTLGFVFVGIPLLVVIAFFWRDLKEPALASGYFLEMTYSKAGETNDVEESDHPEDFKFANALKADRYLPDDEVRPASSQYLVNRNAPSGTMYAAEYLPARRDLGQSRFHEVYNNEKAKSGTVSNFMEAIRFLKSPYNYDEVKDDAAFMARAEKLYINNCSACHGRDGRATGGVTNFGIGAIDLAAWGDTEPNQDAFNKIMGGRAFWAISKGYNTMPSQADKVEPDDRWKIIIWLRHLRAQAKKGPASAG